MARDSDEPTSTATTRRERQILDILFREGEASVAEIQEHLPRSPTAGAVRRMLNLLLAKGAITYRHDGPKKIYRPTAESDEAGESALRHVVETFFAGSASRTMASLFRSSVLDLGEKDKEALAKLIEKAKSRRGRGS